MKTKAAIAWKAGAPLTIEEVDLEGPRAGEVLIEVKATGICHTDYYTLSGADPEGIFPAILGHEGAGVVVDVGPGVGTVRKGDHVIPLYTPECRECKFCLSRKTNLCQKIRATQGKGLMPDATSRFARRQAAVPLHGHVHVLELHRRAGDRGGEGARGRAVRQDLLHRLRRDDGRRRGRVLGEGRGGRERRRVRPRRHRPERDPGAKMVGADKIIGVDINPKRVELAKKFGMTHFINPNEVENVVDHIVQLTDGGADYSFECVGNVKLMRQALECTHKGWGQSFIIGVAAAGEEISTRPFQLVTGREWKGSAFGGARGRTDVPKIVDWYMEGKINIDDLITHTLPLERINEGFDLMKAGESIRSVVLY